MIGVAGIATDDQFQIDEDVILADPETGLPFYQWLIAPTIRNKVLVQYDFNVAGMVAEDFGTSQLYTAETSVTRHGAEAAVTMPFRGVRTALGGQTLADQLAVGFMQYWGFPPPFLRVPTVYLKHVLEPLDIVRVSHPLIRNPLTGRVGLSRELFIVVNVNPRFLTEGRLDLLLMWRGAIETSAAPTGLASGLIPPTTFLDQTDVGITLGGASSVNTHPDAGATVKNVRIGLRHHAWRWWLVRQRDQVLDPKQGCLPFASASVWNTITYNGSVTYVVDYKTAAAPNVPGTGTDPTTGGVNAPGFTWPQTRGNTAQYAGQFCFSTGAEPAPPEPGNPGTPSEDFWTLAFTALAASPNAYNFRVTWQSRGAAGNPGLSPDCFPGGDCPTVLVSESMKGDQFSFTIDFLESQP